ncbi:MAG: dihydroxyacetone kinase-like predicted kinase [Paracoccaceae bacterium]
MRGRKSGLVNAIFHGVVDAGAQGINLFVFGLRAEVPRRDADLVKGAIEHTMVF